jgi:Putative MetA-pathway of phenol degradation
LVNSLTTVQTSFYLSLDRHMRSLVHLSRPSNIKLFILEGVRAVCLKHQFITFCFTCLLVSLFPSWILGQEMEPRAYSRAPVGTQYLVFSYIHQKGDVLTDSSLPLRDVSVKLNSGILGYGRTFNLYGRQASVGVVVPYVLGRARGTVFEEQTEVRRSGLGDLRLRFTTNLIGGPALTRREFSTYKPRTFLGVSLTVVVPTGQYDPRRLVNIGSNRWAVKPEMGLSKPLGRWTLELAGGAWFFTKNNDFFGGAVREQKALSSFQAHLVYTLRPRMWVAMNATYYSGGRTVVNGVVNADARRNSRVGGTFSLPMTSRQSIKVALAKGVTARFGGDLTTVAVGWQYTWVE